MDNKQTAFAFLDGTTDARTPGWQMNIQNGKLYSYNEVIGEHNEDGTVTIYTSKWGAFSNTTTRHISMLGGACLTRGIQVLEK